MFRSKIWSISTDDFSKLVKESNSIGEILKRFGLSNKGGNSKTVQRRAKIENIDISHIKLGINSNKGRTFGQRKSHSEIFKESSPISRSSIKKQVIKYNLIPYVCGICFLKDIWNNKKLILQLDHINGINNDNRIENLRFLCPNCHSQTATFSGKRNSEFLTKQNKLLNDSICHFCGVIFQTSNKLKKYCSKNCISKNRLKNSCLDKETLCNDIIIYSNIQMAKKYGVSECTIRNWLKRNNINRK